MAVYDSAKVRYAARKINMLVDCLDVDVKHIMDTATEGQERLRGKAAAAMEEDRQQLIDMANKLGRDMEALAHQLNAYAVVLEEIDEQLAEKL